MKAVKFYVSYVFNSILICWAFFRTQKYLKKYLQTADRIEWNKEGEE